MAISLLSSRNFLGIPYRRTDTSAFWNITLKGTRYLQHDVHVYGPADIAFCNETRSPGFRNVLDDGLCGMNGYASGADVFRTSTHELDSTCVFVWGTGIYAAAPTITANIGRLIGDQVMYFGSESFESFFSSQTIVLSSDFNSLSVSTATYLLVRGRPIFLSTETSGTLRRMTEAEYEEAIMEALEMNNVTQTTRNSITIPVNGCLVEPCPTDEMWCETDPNCSESPYEENATVKGGVIAGFTILGAFILIAGIVALYQYKIYRIKQKAKFKFSKRMAQSFHHIVNDSALVTPEELIEEFHKIESNDGEGGDGLISKAEMWLFVTSKDGDMTEKEFDVLFAAVDKNKSGMIDFAEFCAFFCELNNNNKNG